LLQWLQTRLRAPFLKNVAILASGTAMAQLLTILAYPILMRLFSPDQFGLFAVFGSIIMTVMALASGRYELAIVTSRSEVEAANTMVLSLLLATMTALASSSAILVFREQIVDLLGLQDISGWIWALPIAILTAATNQIMSFWATRQKLYKLQSSATIARSAGVAAVQIASGVAGSGVGGLILGLIFGSILTTLILSSPLMRKDFRSTGKSINFWEMKRLAWEHRVFPFYSMPQALLSTSTVTVPAILLTSLFNPYVAGLYWFTHRLFEMPITLLGDATRRVFYQQAAELFHQGKDLTSIFLRTSCMLAAITVVPVISMIAAGPWLYAVGFGDAWYEAGEFARWIVIWWAMRFISLPALMLVPIMGLQRRFLLLEITNFIPRLLVLPVAAMFADVHVAVAVYSMVSYLFHLILVLMIWRAVREHRISIMQCARCPALP
jgi:O-antigen/teichoic acid export membrane protein